MVIMRIPSQIKTDHISAYVSNKLKQFFAYYNIKYITTVLHNPAGQGVVESCNPTLKEMLIRQRDRISSALTLNFWNVSKKGSTAAKKYWVIKKTVE